VRGFLLRSERIAAHIRTHLLREQALLGEPLDATLQRADETRQREQEYWAMALVLLGRGEAPTQEQAAAARRLQFKVAKAELFHTRRSLFEMLAAS